MLKEIKISSKSIIFKIYNKPQIEELEKLSVPILSINNNLQLKIFTETLIYQQRNEVRERKRKSLNLIKSMHP